MSGLAHAGSGADVLDPQAPSVTRANAELFSLAREPRAHRESMNAMQKGRGVAPRPFCVCSELPAYGISALK
jgi:hypothetical protein